MKKRKEILLITLVILLSAAFRFNSLTKIPIALHGDELGVAYNAYSLLLTGRDEYGEILPLTFRNDFMPIIFYLTIPVVRILGLSEMAVRLPSALFSVIIIPLLYSFVKIFFRDRKLALLTAFLMAISSWDIRISRIGVGISLALFFQLGGLIYFYKALKSSRLYLLLSYLLFSLSMFTYQTPKITTPLLLLSLIFIYRRSLAIKNNLTYIKYLFIVFIIIPTIVYFLARPIKDTRFAAISVFTLWRSYFPSDSSVISYLKPQAIFKLITMITNNYFAHFNPYILFLDNTLLRYHQLANQGLFYLWQAVFILIGFVYYLRNIKNKASKLIFAWLIISPIPSALTSGVPNANISRALMMLPIIILFISKGVLVICAFIRRYYVTYLPPIQMAIVISTVVAIKSFILAYYLYEPSKYTEFWGLHLKEAALYANNLEDEVDQIIFTTSSSPQGYMYILFYGNKDPLWLINNKRNRAEIVGYSGFGKYTFRPVKWESDKNLPNTLLIGTSDEIPSGASESTVQISSPTGKPLFRIVKTGKI